MSRNTTGRDGIAYLEGLVDDRDEYTRSVHEKQQQATEDTMTNIANSVERSEEAIKVLKVVRDTSAETELVLVALATTGGAGLVSGNAVLLTATEGATGGAAATGLILGSVGKGAIKWQDTGSIGEGVAEGYTELAINCLTFGLRSGLARVADRVAVGLIFGMVKGALKMGPASYLSPEEVAKGKKHKSVAEWLLPSLANIPSAIARDVVNELSKDPKWAIPATVLLKMGLKYGADALAKTSETSPPGPVSAIRTNLGPAAISGLKGSLRSQNSPVEALRVGREAVHLTHSSCLLDCARPSETLCDGLGSSSDCVLLIQQPFGDRTFRGPISSRMAYLPGTRSGPAQSCAAPS